MKIRCKNLLSGINIPGKGDGWVTVGKEYVVLEVSSEGRLVKYRIMGDDGKTPALQDARLFEIISSNIPNKFVFELGSNGDWSLTPEAWSGETFWSAYFDGDPLAVTVFNQVSAGLNALGF